MNPIKNYFLSARHDVVIFSLVAATIILAIVYSVFSASTLSSTQLGVGTSTPGAAIAVVGGFLVAGGDAQILGPLNTTFINATGTTASFINFASTTSLSASNLISINGGGTSTIANGLTVGTSGGTFGVGTSTPGQEVGIFGDILQSSGATTTHTVYSTSGTQGGCIELESPSVAGEWVRVYVGGFGATNTASSAVIQADGRALLVVELGRCQ